MRRNKAMALNLFLMLWSFLGFNWKRTDSWKARISLLGSLKFLNHTISSPNKVLVLCQNSLKVLNLMDVIYRTERWQKILKKRKSWRKRGSKRLWISLATQSRKFLLSQPRPTKPPAERWKGTVYRVKNLSPIGINTKETFIKDWKCHLRSVLSCVQHVLVSINSSLTWRPKSLTSNL